MTVSQDVSALDQAANGLVSALNNVLQTINQYSSYSPTSGAGPLLGDVGLQVLRNNLLSAITSPANGSALSTPYGSLSAVGFTINSDGTVSLNDQAFQTAAQSNYAAVAGLLGTFAVADNPNVADPGYRRGPARVLRHRHHRKHRRIGHRHGQRSGG